MENINIPHYKIFIESTEFQQKVLDYISSDEFNKMVDCTIYKDSPNCRQAIIYGMALASMLTSRCMSYCCVQETEKE